MKNFYISFILILFLITGCGPSPTTSSSAPLPLRDNTSAQEVILKEGTYQVGSDISPGRYTITSNSEGTIAVSNLDIQAVSEHFNPLSGIKSLTINLIDAMEVSLQGSGDFSFVPATTEILKDTLTTGTWVVGLDFEPGDYTATVRKGVGHLSLFDEKARPKSQGEFTKDGGESFELTLESGDIISIVGLPEVDFKKK